VVPGGSSVYLYFPQRVNFTQALDKCRSYGMTLLELYSQDQFDTWNNIKFILFAIR
jgi:hypothetical protein